jgi:AcrR family transcriptional regulator
MDTAQQDRTLRKAEVTGDIAAGPEAVCDKDVSHNLNGQRLGRKGRDTRQRIIAAAQSLLARPEPVPITLSAVAREASLGMTSLYLYFTDLTELLLAVLEPVVESAEDAYVASMRSYWSDDILADRCWDFVQAYHAFWQKHARILHMRNAMADQHDRRMMMHRITTAQVVIDLLLEQMDHEVDAADISAAHMASAMMTGIERAITLATDAYVRDFLSPELAKGTPERLRAVARLMELGIRDFREPVAGG